MVRHWYFGCRTKFAVAILRILKHEHALKGRVKVVGYQCRLQLLIRFQFGHRITSSFCSLGIRQVLAIVPS